MLAAGFTDDLFPVDETLRFANRTRARFPRTPLSLLLGDLGHQRASNKPRERRRLVRSIHRWFDHYLRGSGNRPPSGATAYVETCPRSRPSLGPFRAESFNELTRRRVRLRTNSPQIVSSAGGDPATGARIDPVTGGGDACVSVPVATSAGTALVDKRVREGRHRTVIGAPEIKARLEISGAAPEVSQLDGRLWDVAPDGASRTLVARGTYRPRASGPASWVLHTAAWRFESGHTIELELLGNDAPYARPSNGTFSTTVSDLRVRLPVR
jgi:hypothetical protein